MEFVGYDTHEKLIWTSGEGNIIKNKIIKQGITKTQTNKISPSSKLGFGCSPHKGTCDIFSKIWFHPYFKHIIEKKGIVLRYMKKVKYIHSIGLPKRCGYHNCG